MGLIGKEMGLSLGIWKHEKVFESSRNRCAATMSRFRSWHRAARLRLAAVKVASAALPGAIRIGSRHGCFHIRSAWPLLEMRIRFFSRGPEPLYGG